MGGLRGAIAFALALNINTPNSDLIITTTLSIVILTTILCGCSTKYMLDSLDLNNIHRRMSTETITDSFTFSEHDNYHKLNTKRNSNKTSTEIEDDDDDDDIKD